MRNLLLTLEYDGTDFFGWQRQQNLRTVQQVVEDALSQLLQEGVTLYTAGRTDTGVHALAQNANFKTKSGLSQKTIHRGANAILPRDVRLLEVSRVPPDFHARFSARKRYYRYIICKRQRAIGRQYAWYCPYRLEIEYMRKACTAILGELDFKSFCKANADVNHYRCHVSRAEWRESSEEVIFFIAANRFLHNMVRTLVGTFVNIGRGQVAPRSMQEILQARDRRRAGPNVPPYGLYLEKIEYQQE